RSTIYSRRTKYPRSLKPLSAQCKIWKLRIRLRFHREDSESANSFHFPREGSRYHSLIRSSNKKMRPFLTNDRIESGRTGLKVSFIQLTCRPCYHRARRSRREWCRPPKLF